MTTDNSKYTREQMVEKIQKLLNLADSTATNEHQAAAAAAKAQSLMEQWAIDEAALDAAAGRQSDPFTSETVPYLKTHYLRWEGSLLMTVAESTMTHAFKNDYRRIFTFAGRSQDVKVAVYTFVQLRGVLERMSRTRLSEHGAATKRDTGKSIYNAAQCRVLSGCHPTVYRQRWLDSWLAGAERGVATKLQEQRQQTTVQSSTALVVIQTRRDEAQAWATVEFGLIKGKGLKARLTFDSAHSKGFQDGKQIELRKGLTVERSKELEG